ncbi:uncharacterized protein LOC141831171 [Curcuma longa]|uniref:uncharacterized protein LOC141831171 n=1 Tax=Curcuma longa TaxID=136217 RepID=UPI003D9F3E69
MDSISSPFCFPDAMDKSWFHTNILLITCSSPEPVPNCNPQKPRFKNRRPAKLSVAAGQSCLSPQETQSCPALSCNFDGSARKELRSQKSLSELENYEVKGFMDLGFVFRKEELSLGIMSMIPGLQRLAMDEESCREGEEEEEDEEGKGRPYLSEAWSSNGRRRLSVVSVPVFGTDMKKQLRSWAKQVAASIHHHHNHHVSK